VLSFTAGCPSWCQLGCVCKPAVDPQKHSLPHDSFLCRSWLLYISQCSMPTKTDQQFSTEPHIPHPIGRGVVHNTQHAGHMRPMAASIMGLIIIHNYIFWDKLACHENVSCNQELSTKLELKLFVRSQKLFHFWRLCLYSLVVGALSARREHSTPSTPFHSQTPSHCPPNSKDTRMWPFIFYKLGIPGMVSP